MIDRERADASDSAAEAEEQVVWQSCSVNCGSHCPLRLHVRNGEIQWVESDMQPERAGEPQMRACLRGRSLRWWLSAPERLDAPLRRTGPRGSGQFERISWDEALDYVAGEIRRIVAAYGNDAVLLPYATGLYPAEGSPFERLMNCYGGHLGVYGDYSCAQLQAAATYTYGDDGYYSGSTMSEAAHASLVVLFGGSPSGTRMGGASAGWEFNRARERGEFKLVCIDPRHSETMAASRKGDEWIAIRPGTDAAFVAGIAHVLITENLVDQEFLDTYCIGYDASTMPVGAPANGSYKDYILGTGPDGVAKTPAWAAAITGVSRQAIVRLAREMAAARALFVAQGWGPQRRDNGELTARAIFMPAILTGNIGLPGTNSGVRERFLPFTVPMDPVGENPVQVSIPAFRWLEAVERGATMTARNAGVRGAERLRGPVKMIINHAGNCLTNQHADINHVHDVLSDESACECIVVCDLFMTDSARYADIVLPDVARSEQANLVSSGNADMVRALVRGGDWGAKRRDRRCAWDIAAALADRLGVGKAFRAIGATRDDVDRCRISLAQRGAVSLGSRGSIRGSSKCAPACADEISSISLEELGSKGLVKAPYKGPHVAYAEFRADPKAHPLPTPSGKIEIYSQRLAKLQDALDIAPWQVIDPLPVYAPEPEGWDSPLAAEFPFQLIGYHARQHVHSSFANVQQINVIAPRAMAMNPLDAERYDVVSGDRVVVESPRGALVIAVRVTPRIMPGVLAIPQGAWHKADMAGNRLDWGGCINTLTSLRPTPLASGNGQNTTRARVTRLVEWLAEHGEEGEPCGQ